MRSGIQGTTLLLGSAAALNVAPVLAKNFPSDLVANLTPLTLAVELPMCLVVNKFLPVSNITELIAYAKAHPGKLAFGSSGPNTVHHIAGEFLKVYAGIDWVHVPYRGGSLAMTDLLAGQIPVLFATLSTAIPFIDSGAVSFLGPPKMSATLVARMNAELVSAISTPKARKALEDSGFEVDTSTPEEFASVIKAGLERYKRITAEAGIEAE